MDFTLLWGVITYCLYMSFNLGSLKNSVDNLIKECDNNFKLLNKTVLNVNTLEAKQGK